jgi:Calcineurin-like phosphoesterase
MRGTDRWTAVSPRHWRRRRERRAGRGVHLPARSVLVAAILAAVATLLPGSRVIQSAESAPASWSFTAAADAYVSSSKPKANYGTAKTLRVDGSPIQTTYLRFTVQGITSPVASASLRVYTTAASSTGFEVRGVGDNSWSETAITYANAPPAGTKVATSGAVSSGLWVSIDVTPLVSGNGSVSLALTTPTKNVTTLASREASASRMPQLVVDSVEPPANTSPPTISGSPVQGQTLTADPGSWSGTAPLAYAYQWRRCDAGGGSCSDIAGATATSYTLVAADVGSTIRVRVTATNSAGSAAASSEPTAVVEPGANDPVIAAAGDIACSPLDPNFNGGLGTATACRQRYTSDLLLGGEVTAVFPLGDLAYECGSTDAFTRSYDPSWGRLNAIAHPIPGNHEYQTTGADDCDTTGQATPYFDYFGATAGDPSKGYYSYDIGSWHIVALNTNSACATIACAAGSTQEQWLQADLAAHPADCTLAYWHHPLFSSTIAATSASQALWQDLYDAGADVILNGHAHVYERFAPQTPSGALDTANGIREFVVGTGGAALHAFSTIEPNSQARNNTTFGVLKLTLHPTGYDWAFTPEAGGTFTDSGSDSCH